MAPEVLAAAQVYPQEKVVVAQEALLGVLAQAAGLVARVVLAQVYPTVEEAVPVDSIQFFVIASHAAEVLILTQAVEAVEAQSELFGLGQPEHSRPHVLEHRK